MFLEAEGSLAASHEWHSLHPVHGSLLEGIARLPRQLLGSDSNVPSTVEATQNARHTSDLLRRFRELGEKMKQEYQVPALSGEEQALRVRRPQWEHGVRPAMSLACALFDSCDARHACRSARPRLKSTKNAWPRRHTRQRRWCASLRRWGQVRVRGTRARTLHRLPGALVAKETATPACKQCWGTWASRSSELPSLRTRRAPSAARTQSWAWERAALQPTRAVRAWRLSASAASRALPLGSSWNRCSRCTMSWRWPRCVPERAGLPRNSGGLSNSCLPSLAGRGGRVQGARGSAADRAEH